MVLDEIFKESKDLKIGFCAGSMDLTHPGHFLMFREAKEHCDILIVALQSDPSIDRDTKNSPVQGMFARYVSVQSNKHVDYVLPYSTEEDLYNMLKVLPINIRVLDETYNGQNFTGKDLGIEIIYNKRQHNYSSSGLRKDVENKAKKNK